MNPSNARRSALNDFLTSEVPRLRFPPRTLVAVASGVDDSHHKAPQERAARVRVLAGSLLGVALLILAQWLQPHGGAPLSGPHGATAWLGAVWGAAGIWLVPGTWLCALIMHTGTDPLAKLATRIGVLLAWYALAGIVVHYAAQGAAPTAWSIIGVTTAATAATCLGVALGLLPRPTDHRARILVSAAAGGLGAQLVIWLAMTYWTYQVNYQHIRRLDWLIVLTCALLAALGQANRPLPPMCNPVGIRPVLGAVTALTAATAVTVAAAVTWPTTQHLPSEVTAEQIPTPAGADLALALTGIGPRGSGVLRGVSFTATDDLGRPVPARFSLMIHSTATDHASLLIVLDPTARPTLCGPTSPSPRTLPVKVTLRDRNSGLSVQARPSARWCAR